MAEPVLNEAKLLRDLGRMREQIEKRLGRLVDDSSARALRSVAEVWMTEAKKRTPVEAGVLRASGHVQGPEKVGDAWQVRLVFGGPAAPYALLVHERLAARHAVGQAKYLESVVLERRERLSHELAAMLVGGGQVHRRLFG